MERHSRQSPKNAIRKKKLFKMKKCKELEPELVVGVDTMEPNGDNTNQELDPADYLFQTTKYHDCHFTVGNPDTDQVELFGVSSSQLVSHSTVFREMLVENEPTGNTRKITNVTPKVFKLMLRHVYGGTLPRNISREMAADLALCADKYNIQPLVSRAAAWLVPTTVQDVFVALRSVVNIDAPDLEKQVVLIIQEQTDKIIEDKEFLHLDPNCLEFIAMQDKLTVTELELWKGLFKWANHRTDDPAEMRQLLDKPLRHVRFLTFTIDTIIKEVMPSKVLRAEETVDLLLAVSSQKPLQIEGLCSSQQKRAGKESLVKSVEVFPSKINLIRKNLHFNSLVDASGGIPARTYVTKVKELAESSNFTIRTLKYMIEIQSLTCKARYFEKKDEPLYPFRCDIKMLTIIKGFNTKVDTSTVEGQAGYNESIHLPLASNNGTSLLLEPNISYNFNLRFSSPHPVFTSGIRHEYNKEFDNPTATTYVEKKCDDVMTVQFNTPFHVLAINLKY